MNDSLQRRSAAYVDELLKGATPADLPVLSPQRSSWVNLKTTKVDLTVLDNLVVAADEVVE